jgi:ankyrin repeat protein
MRRIETFLNYIKHQNIEKVVTFFNTHKLDVNDKTLDCSLLEYAIKKHNKEASLFLLEKGADVNHQNEQGMNALMLILSNRLSFSLNDKLKFLPSDLNNQDKTGSTLLIYAVYFKDKELTQYLIKKGANLDIQNDNLRCALHYAAEHDNLPLLNLLLKAKANPNLVDSEDETPLLMSTNLDNIQATEKLLNSGANIEYISKDGYSAFLHALLNNNLELSKKLFFDTINLDEIKEQHGKIIHKTNLNYFITLKEKNILEKQLTQSTNNQVIKRKI